MAIEIFASAGAFTPESEQPMIRGVFAALLAAIDATDNENISGTIGASLYVIPAERMLIGGRAVPNVRIDVVVPAIGLASFRRRRRFIADATAAVVAHASDPTIEDRVVVRILHAVDGGWGIGGHALTNDVLDEGPE